jgi:hypothetical protein
MSRQSRGISTTRLAAPLRSLILVGTLITGCAGSMSAPESPCTAEGGVQLDDDVSLPICGTTVTVSAVGEGFNLLVNGSLPDARRLGDDQGQVNLSIPGYTGPGTYAFEPRKDAMSGFSIQTYDSAIGLSGTRASGPRWDGSCRLDVGPPQARIAGACELFSEGRASIPVRIDLPAPSEELAWIEAEYELRGSYAASGRLRLAAPTSEGFVLVIPLPDGAQLVIVPEGERPVFLDTVPAGSAHIVDHRPAPENGMRPFDPSFGRCTLSFDAAWLGTVDCPGSANSVNGSVTLQLETRSGS